MRLSTILGTPERELDEDDWDDDEELGLDEFDDIDEDEDDEEI
jgi:hypothetical protein